MHPISSERGINLVVRFTLPIADLRLPILSPGTSNAAAIVTLVRPHLPSEYQTCSIRLIYAGALLPASQPLSTSLRLAVAARRPVHQHQSQDFYVHCSISSEVHLSTLDLDQEKEVGIALSSTRQQTARIYQNDSTGSSAQAIQDAPEQVEDNTLVAPPPQGFDRLLSAGLTTSEVASLRSQFVAIQSHVHTPDTMPSPRQLRFMEERWLDSGNTPGLGGDGQNDVDGMEGGGIWDGAGDTGEGGLDDMLWGNVMGFFWAVGAMTWLMREEGVWSQRRKVGIVTGLLVNMAFCMLRLGS